MPLVNIVVPEEAEGKLAELYASAEQFFGAVPNSVKVLGVSPAVLENQMHFAQYFMTHPTLSQPLLTSIRLLVAHQTDSPYCVNMNAGFLMKQGVAGDQVEMMKRDPADAPLKEKERKLLGFVLKAVKQPHSVTADDIAQLTSAGWTEQEIFDAVVHGSRAVATNIVFDTFNLESE